MLTLGIHPCMANTFPSDIEKFKCIFDDLY